jgi:hypothetical protein
MAIPASKLDSIANRLAVSQETNRNLSDTPPIKYFGDLLATARSHGTENDVVARFSASLIPAGVASPDFLKQFEVDALDAFLAARAHLILERIKQLVGESLKTEPAEDEVEDS